MTPKGLDVMPPHDQWVKWKQLATWYYKKLLVVTIGTMPQFGMANAITPNT